MSLREQLQALADGPWGASGTARGPKVKKGYAGVPGTGPEGETCRSCRHLYKVQGGNKAFPKCALRAATRGPATDVLMKSPACARWAAKAPEPKA